MITTIKHSPDKPPLKRRKLNNNQSIPSNPKKNSVHSTKQKSKSSSKSKTRQWTPQSPSPSPPSILSQLKHNNYNDIEIEIDTFNTHYKSDGDDNYSDISLFMDQDDQIPDADGDADQSPSPPWGRSPSPPPSNYFHKPTKKKSRWDDKNELIVKQTSKSKKKDNGLSALITAGVNSLIHSINLQQQKQQKIEPLLLDEHGNPLTNNSEIMDEFDDELYVEEIINGDDDEDTDEFFDDNIMNKPAERTNRRSAFKFIEQGTYTARAHTIRAKELANLKHKPRRIDIEAVAKKLHDDEGLEWLDPVPNVEWWDCVLLTDKQDYNCIYKKEMITDLIENPKILRPELLTDNNQINDKNAKNSGGNTGGSMSWILTKKERKKIRRMKKKEEHQLRTDEIRLGLREPPEPRINLSNIIAVLGSAAIKDPTAAESIARAQMWKRKVKHELHNATNQLNPQQRREKKRKKLQEDTSKEVYVSLFVIYKLYGKLNKTKICQNAQQRNLTGGLIMLNNKEEDVIIKKDEDLKKIVKKEVGVEDKNDEDDGIRLNMVIVEGGPKGISKYQRLLMHRIKWGNDMVSSVDQDGGYDKKNCAKVWEGTVAKRAFQTFHQKRMKNESDLRKFLKMHNVLSYWDMVKNSSAVTSNV